MTARFLVIVVWLALTLSAWGELLSDPILFRKDVGSDYERIVFTNSAAVPVSIKLSCKLTNATAVGPDLLCLPAKGSLAGPTFRRRDAGKSWSYRFTYQYNFGDYRLTAAKQPFELPWPSGVSYKTGQSFHGSLSHHGSEGYAVDFPMPVGTLINAAGSGLVVRVVEHHTEGGWRPELRDKGNQVTIAHQDGTLSRYLHLQPQGALVELGQWVSAGDPIARSGNTGFSNGPHLHFDVCRPGTDLVTVTIPFKFRVNGAAVVPVEGQTYRR